VTGRGWLGLLLVILLAGSGGLIWFRAEGEAPTVEGPEALDVGAAGREIALEIADSKSGLRQIRVSILREGAEKIVLERAFAGSFVGGGVPPQLPERVTLTIDPKAMELADGESLLSVVAHDWSWRNSFRGNETKWQIPLRIDRKKPPIRISSGLTYVDRGGSGVVAYTLGEATVRDGVAIGDAFYRGYPAPGADAASRRRVAVFAVPTHAPKNPKIEVVAEDAAGNLGRASWSVVLKEKMLPKANINLSARFLETKVESLAAAQEIDASDLSNAFDQINTELRAKNEAQIREVVTNSSETQLWENAFTQLRNSKVTSRFAEQRSYFVDGRPVSKATHFGYDLASTAGTPIEASNTGLVVFADDLGIYGNCVIIDHGLGIFSLYAHLSSIGVSVGDRVEKNAELGRSGDTGLAGGDHLHFAVIVGGTYVEPLEWWDPEWVRTHVDARLAR
jgi:murein DD-endopeptidase MepM/ murein hydrolase activator NlpD